MTEDRQAFIEALQAQIAERREALDIARSELAKAQANYELAVKMYMAVRDHILALMTDEDRKKFNWSNINVYRHLGKRIGEVILEVLDERQEPLTLEEIQLELEDGGFDFHSKTPLREINAALINHPRVERVGNKFVSVGKKEKNEI